MIGPCSCQVIFSFGDGADITPSFNGKPKETVEVIALFGVLWLCAGGVFRLGGARDQQTIQLRWFD